MSLGPRRPRGQIRWAPPLWMQSGVLTTALLATTASSARAQEGPYFVTYTHYLEEPGNLDIAVNSTTGVPNDRHAIYTAPWLELEYGLSAWWTTEVYLEGVTTRGDGSGWTGWRWENRIRPLQGEHRLNPVLYLEYEHISEASRIQKEIAGTGSLDFGPIQDLRAARAHEIETKVILSSALGSWNVAENLVVEKNLSRQEGIEFGYSVGVARSLGTVATAGRCRWCRENFEVGVELYGGLGSTHGLGVRETRHFLAPVVAWHLSDRSTLRLSPGFGLTHDSDRFLLRLGWSYEFATRGAK